MVCNRSVVVTAVSSTRALALHRATSHGLVRSSPSSARLALDATEAARRTAGSAHRLRSGTLACSAVNPLLCAVRSPAPLSTPLTPPARLTSMHLHFTPHCTAMTVGSDTPLLLNGLPEDLIGQSPPLTPHATRPLSAPPRSVLRSALTRCHSPPLLWQLASCSMWTAASCSSPSTASAAPSNSTATSRSQHCDATLHAHSRTHRQPTRQTAATQPSAALFVAAV